MEGLEGLGGFGLWGCRVIGGLRLDGTLSQGALAYLGILTYTEPIAALQASDHGLAFEP